MLAKLKAFRGANPTTVDAVKAAAVIVGGTLLSVLLADWMQRQSTFTAYSTAVRNGGWLLAVIVSMRYTTMKGWPRGAQAIVIGVLLAVVGAIVVGAA